MTFSGKQSDIFQLVHGYFEICLKDVLPSIPKSDLLRDHMAVIHKSPAFIIFTGKMKIWAIGHTVVK